jgi:hypothetical protein
VTLWRCRLQRQIRARCPYAAEFSLAAAERLQGIKRPCQQKDARIYAEQGWDAVLAVGVHRCDDQAGTQTCTARGTAMACTAASTATTGMGGRMSPQPAVGRLCVAANQRPGVGVAAHQL